MAYCFRFNPKNMESIMVEGARVDVRGRLITVVDECENSLATFSESDLTAWYQIAKSPL